VDLYSFVYRGVLADEAIRQLRRVDGVDPKQPEADIQRRLPLEILEDAHVLAARRMSWVYTAIAAFENGVRSFIEERLLEKVGATWWDSAVSAGIKTEADRRKKDEEQIRWHGSRGTSPLAYVQLEDLAVIIQNNHAHFKDLIPTAEWAREIFRTLSRSRNVIMHSGQLTLADVERVAMNIRDWVRQVGA
jgi:HEPN superfamily Swt1-like protein